MNVQVQFMERALAWRKSAVRGGAPLLREDCGVLCRSPASGEALSGEPGGMTAARGGAPLLQEDCGVLLVGVGAPPRGEAFPASL